MREPVLRFARLPTVLAAGISRRPPGSINPEHDIPDYELNYHPTGHARQRLNGAQRELHGGRAYVYHPGDRVGGVALADGGPPCCYWVRFHWPEARDGADHAPPVPRVRALDGAERVALQAQFDALVEAHGRGSPGWQVAAAGHLLVMLALIAQAPPVPAPRGRRLEARLARAQAHIERHHARPIRIAEIARAAGLNADYFARAFRRRLGCSPVEHLMRVRARAARRLLLDDPTLPVAEAGRRVGCDDPRWFGRLFRRCYGCSPGEFRDRAARAGE